MNSIFIILPNQLFEDIINNQAFIQSTIIYLLEEDTFFIKYKFHKMKLVLHRASMKAYYDYLVSISDKKIIYIESHNCKQQLEMIFKKHNNINIYDPIDHKLMKLFNKFSNMYKSNLMIHHNLLFIETNEELDEYYNNLKSHENYIHDNGFYKWQRTRLDILMVDNKPLFGKLSYDHNNRKKFNTSYNEPTNPVNNKNKYIQEAKEYVEKNWQNNFGDIDNFFYPITFNEANTLLTNFIKQKLLTFGDYEDATSSIILFGSHSLLSSSINIGIITISNIIKKILKFFYKLPVDTQKKIINNVEGFIRQIIGWRSYVRFIYRYHGETMYNENHFKHNNKLTNNWYNGTTEIYPIDIIINKVKKYAYCHHIERLMYIGNFMLLSKINPKDVYKWFMICFIDSYVWVMVPNVMGMSQYSSSSIKMMTKPYFSSSNYIKLMSDYKLNSYNIIILDEEEYYWNQIWDALYYNFINDNCDELKRIYSFARNVSHWNKKTKNEQERLLNIAKIYLENY